MNSDEKFLSMEQFSRMTETFRVKIEVTDRKKFPKSEEKSGKFRAKGNELYAQKKYMEAIVVYNLAILYAPYEEDHHSVSAALSISNRSMCYFYSEQIKEAINDIEASIELGFPDSEKLIERKKLYQNHLKAETIEWVDKEVTEDAYEEFMTPKTGRGLRAKKDLEPEEVILREKAYCSVLETRRFEQFCYCCLRKIRNQQVFPCPTCSQVRFCSTYCSLKSYREYHRLECGFLDLMKSSMTDSNMSARVALKIALTVGMDNLVSASGIDPAYQKVRQLVSPGPIGGFNVVLAFMTSFCIYCSGQDELMDDEMALETICSRLCECMRQVKANAMSVTHRRLVHADFDSKAKVLVEETIGCALFLVQPMINHSCEPNIKTAKFDGDIVSLQTIEPIKSGTEIFNSYGSFAKWEKTAIRKTNLLSNYHFNCECTACASLKEPQVDSFRCSSCKGPVTNRVCTKCKHKISQDSVSKMEKESSSVMSKMTAALSSLDEQDAKKFLLSEKQLNECYNKLRKIVYPENKLMVMLLDKICSFYVKASIRKRKSTACDFSLKLLEVTKKAFNEDVHLFNTYVKVLEVMRVHEESAINVKTVVDEATKLMESILPIESIERVHFRLYLSGWRE